MNRIILLLLISHAGLAQPEVKNLRSIPAGIRYTGEIKNSVTWKDNSGEHFVVTTEIEIDTKGEPGSRDAALYAYHYLGNTQTWRVYDYIKACPVDIKAKFVKNSFAVTDLDKNGASEVWLMYTTVCHGDASPSNMKIIMYEGDKKHAMRGRTRVPLSATEFMGGEYTFDEPFKNALETFRAYAKKLWKKNIDEKWSE